MMDINDPDMRDIVLEFCDETIGLIEEMTNLLEDFEEDFKDCSLLEKFGQTIDRVMGAADTLCAGEIGNLCRMGKIIGYKASQSQNTSLNEVTVNVLFDLIELLSVLTVNIKEQKSQHSFNLQAFSERLTWLSEKFKHIDRSSCTIADDSNKVDINATAELEELIKAIGRG